MADQPQEQIVTYRYYVSLSPNEGAVALVRRNATGAQETWAPSSMLANLQLEPVDEPRWISNAWPPADVLKNKEWFDEIGEAEAEQMKWSLQTSATLYMGPDRVNAPASVQVISSGRQFEEHARAVLSEEWGIRLSSRVLTLPGGVAHSFDLVSDDGTVVGDAKWFKDLKPIPAAKLSVIAEYVWLLQNLEGAERRFLVFGQDRAVPVRWLKRFRALLGGVEFWFLDDHLTPLT